MLGVTLRWISIPSKGYKLWPDRPFGWYADCAYSTLVHCISNLVFGVGCSNKNGQASQSKASNDVRRSIQNKRRLWIEQLLSPYISCKVGY